MESQSLGWDLEEKTAKQKEKSAALEKSKQLTNSGKHKEASELFKKHFLTSVNSMGKKTKVIINPKKED